MPNLREALKFTVIGVNRAVDIVPKVSYLLMVDAKLVLSQAANINRACAEGSTVILFDSALTDKVRPKLNCNYVDMGKLDMSADITAKEGPIRMCEGGNTGYFAVQLAYRMGAKIIAMAGIDLWWPAGRKSHACGHGKDLGCKLGPVEEKIKAFAHAAREYAKVGVTLTSVSPWRTRLRKAVGYTPLSEVIKRARGEYESSLREEVNSG
jgi:hypothetical protein